MRRPPTVRRDLPTKAVSEGVSRTATGGGVVAGAAGVTVAGGSGCAADGSVVFAGGGLVAIAGRSIAVAGRSIAVAGRSVAAVAGRSIAVAGRSVAAVAGRSVAAVAGGGVTGRTARSSNDSPVPNAYGGCTAGDKRGPCSANGEGGRSARCGDRRERLAAACAGIPSSFVGGATPAHVFVGTPPWYADCAGTSRIRVGNPS